MKSIVLLLFVATCASAYYYSGYSPYPYGSYYSGYNPIWRKKRAAPEAPAEDQKADEAFLYNYYAMPYSAYTPYSGSHYLKKREAPAEDQKADEAFLYNYYAHPYSSYYPYSGVHYLKKREAPAEDQKAQEAKLLYSGYTYPYYSSYGAHAPYFYKK